MQNHRILTSLAECIITSWSDCNPPSSCSNAHVLTVCFIVTVVYIVIVMFGNRNRPLLTLTFVFLAVGMTYIALEVLLSCHELLCWMFAMQQLYLIDRVMSCYSLLLMCGFWFSLHELLRTCHSLCWSYCTQQLLILHCVTNLHTYLYTCWQVDMLNKTVNLCTECLVLDNSLQIIDDE